MNELLNPDFLPWLLGFAVLAPLFSFFLILVTGRWIGKHGSSVAIFAIGAACVLSFLSLFIWLANHGGELASLAHADHESHAADHDDSAGGEHEQQQGHPEERQTDEHGDENHAEDGDAASAHSGAAEHDDHAHEAHVVTPPYYTGDYSLFSPIAVMGDLQISISYYIDSLTIVMFCMVTFIATLIHIYATGYMHDELHDFTDHEATLADGSHPTRPGRYPRFFQYLSLFCFSMLGLVVSGNIAMVFVFWELVGICSYFLIGFYIERRSASTAANKAFIVNRVGDFGMIIGLMALWASLGTFAFGDYDTTGDGIADAGIFSQVRPAVKPADVDDADWHPHRLITPAGMVRFSAREEIAEIVLAQGPDASREEIEAAIAAQLPKWRSGENPAGKRYGYMLLIVAVVGIFCGCVGKTAQFPLHTWLPDAMEGPTPVSALVHSATMVAAGVYLVARFYPVFAPEVLLVIACVGVITLFMAATIAITATDIKRVLAYSTVSQLGYMMLALGVGGWIAGVLHLITHAFFKSLLFMCSGSVIHAVHTNEMTEMGGLRKKMPYTAYTMLVGCLAIAGISVPFVVGFSGYYSKDFILEQAFHYMTVNPSSLLGALFFTAAAGGAAITAFYMFRLWYLTFAGKPRNQQRYDHAHESPRSMYMPLVILAVLATGVAWHAFEAMAGAVVLAVVGLVLAIRFTATSRQRHEAHEHEHGHEHDDHHPAQPSARSVVGAILIGAVIVALVGLGWSASGAGNVGLQELVEQARPAGTAVAETVSGAITNLQWPNEHVTHDHQLNYYAIIVPVTLLATGTALGGIFLASVMYLWGYLSAGEVRRQFEPAYRLLINKWWFDELYDFVFVRPTLVLSRVVAALDRNWIDWFVDGSAACTRRFALFWDWLADFIVVDGTVNLIAGWTYSLALSLRGIQVGKLRKYVMFIVVGLIVLFLLITIFRGQSLAG